MKSDLEHRCWTRRRFCNRIIAGVAGTVAVPQALAAPATPLRAAVIGHTGRGDYGHGLEKIFLNRAGIETVAVADPDEAGRTRIAGQIGAKRSYADCREMLAQERPQLVSVAMRQADQHHDLILACLRAGAHVYSEKPFVTAPFEADQLLAEAARRGLKIAVAHTLRMLPMIVALRAAVREGFLGDLSKMRAYGKQDTRAGGEDMMVLGTHLFDLMRMFAGDPVWCSARVLWKGHDITSRDGRIVKDNVGPVAGDEIFATFAFANGLNGTFTSAQKLRDTAGPWGIEIFGSKGAVRIHCDLAPNVFVRKTTTWKAEGKEDHWEPFDPAVVKATLPKNPGPVGDWLEAIEADREPECSAKNGAWAVEMVMGVYQGALSGRRISFPLPNRQHPLMVG